MNTPVLPMTELTPAMALPLITPLDTSVMLPACTSVNALTKVLAAIPVPDQ